MLQSKQTNRSNIYVDEAVWPWRGKFWCHMMIDRDGDLEDLHQFAQSIGMKREWFQDKPRYPHYDLHTMMRQTAIAKGAIPIESTELINRCKRE